MTGFGAASVTSQGWTMKVEARSVNHKGLDVRVWAPREWAWVEPFALGVVREHAQRGRVELRVELEPDSGSGTTLVDHARFARVAADLRDAARAASIDAAPTIADVLATGSFLAAGDALAVPDDFGPFEEALREGMRALVRSRSEEGETLRYTMVSLLAEVARGVEAVAAIAPAVGAEYQSRLEQRVREALARFELGELDERSILREVAIYADRCDVSEESQRSRSHVARLEELFAATDDEGPVGKQIDFYLQELMRETNTTGSKSGSIEITNHVIAMKSAVEQMREQAANIE